MGTSAMNLPIPIATPHTPRAHRRWRRGCSTRFLEFFAANIVTHTPGGRNVKYLDLGAQRPGLVSIGDIAPSELETSRNRAIASSVA